MNFKDMDIVSVHQKTFPYPDSTLEERNKANQEYRRRLKMKQYTELERKQMILDISKFKSEYSHLKISKTAPKDTPKDIDQTLKPKGTKFINIFKKLFRIK